MNKKIKSLYIHIPFCTHFCYYCDFTKLFYNHKFSEPYLKALFDEIDSYHINKVDTIYIGGGTPTSLNDGELTLLLSKVKPYLNEGGEFSIEANVENLTESKIKIMLAHGVNRLSIGVESTDDKLLKAIGRHHSFDDARRVIALAKSLGLTNINVDLIYGFPHQTMEDLRKDIKNILSLDVDHISTYSLIVNENTTFYKDNVKEQNQDDSRLFYDEILTELRNNGYERYEISNFARNKKYSRHNLTYWHDEEYYGVGLGASGYVNGVRYTNTKNISKYFAHEYVDIKEQLTKEEQIEDFLLCHFRLQVGFLRKDFKNRFGVDFIEMFSSKIDELINDGLLIINDDRIMLSDEGLITMDRILLKLL